MHTPLSQITSLCLLIFIRIIYRHAAANYNCLVATDNYKGPHFYWMIVIPGIWSLILGGILNTVSNSVKAVIITEGAHHLDLMPSNPADPESVKIARQGHKENISKWINQFYNEAPHRRP